jgi:hypothetical protein
MAGMEDGNASAITGEDKIRAMSFAGGLLIAVACFALLFAVLARFIPAFIRFADSPRGRFLPIASIFFVMFSGSLGYSFRRRARRLRSSAAHRRRFEDRTRS